MFQAVAQLSRALVRGTRSRRCESCQPDFLKVSIILTGAEGKGEPMGYQKIKNLYQDPTILTLFREVYCLEKIHGTSAHITWKDGKVSYFSGGEKHANFVKLFDEETLVKKLTEEFGNYTTVTIYGEAYGGSCQRMSTTYGKQLRFVAFEVNIDDHWLDVLNAEDVTKKMGLEFVDYIKGPATLEFVNEQRDRPSTQAIRNGITDEPKLREGVVIRPLIELAKNDGNRLMVKHKGEAFSEHKTPREVNPEKVKVMSDAREIAEDWVTAMRLEHVMDKLSPDGIELTVKSTREVISAMVQDVKDESEGEIVWTPAVSKAIGKAAANLFHRHLKSKLASLE